MRTLCHHFTKHRTHSLSLTPPSSLTLSLPSLHHIQPKFCCIGLILFPVAEFGAEARSESLLKAESPFPTRKLTCIFPSHSDFRILRNSSILDGSRICSHHLQLKFSALGWNWGILFGWGVNPSWNSKGKGSQRTFTQFS